MEHFDQTCHSNRHPHTEFDPMSMEHPYEVSGAKINHALDIGPVIYAARYEIDSIALPSDMEGACHLISIGDIFDELMRLQRIKPSKALGANSFQFEFKKHKIVSGLLQDLQKEIDACKRIGLTISYTCARQPIQVAAEHGLHLQYGWVAYISVEYAHKN